MYQFTVPVATGEFSPVGCSSSCLLPYSQHAATVPAHHHSLLWIYALFNNQRKSNCELVLDPGQMSVLQQPSPQICCLGVWNYRLGKAGVKAASLPPCASCLACPSSVPAGWAHARKPSSFHMTPHQLSHRSSQYCYGNRYIVVQAWEIISSSSNSVFL